MQVAEPKVERFRVLNGLEPEMTLRPRDKVKLVTY
jgi:predicted Zn-dependent protease